MTLPQNVKDAVKFANAECGKSSDFTFDMSGADWQTIRAHMLSQDAEIDRLRNVMAPKLRELHYDANGLRATLGGGACKALAESFAEQFNSSGAVNYLDVEFTTADGTGFIVTVQKRAKPTAHELRRLAESRLAAANERLEAAERKVSRLTAMRNEWERDAREHLMTFGQHLPASVECLVERFDAAIAAAQEGEG